MLPGGCLVLEPGTASTSHGKWEVSTLHSEWLLPFKSQQPWFALICTGIETGAEICTIFYIPILTFAPVLWHFQHFTLLCRRWILFTSCFSYTLSFYFLLNETWCCLRVPLKLVRNCVQTLQSFRDSIPAALSSQVRRLSQMEFFTASHTSSALGKEMEQSYSHGMWSSEWLEGAASVGNDHLWYFCIIPGEHSYQSMPNLDKVFLT